MILKGIIDIDIINYRKISMVLEFPKCDFKCDHECRQQVCQNSALATAPNIEMDIDKIIQKYINDSVTEAVVCQGLEPFDSWFDLRNFIHAFRKKSLDDVVIYTGYDINEIGSYVNYLKIYRNIIIKFGRYIPNQEPHYDKVLGVNLASDNQYAKRIS